MHDSCIHTLLQIQHSSEQNVCEENIHCKSKGKFTPHLMAMSLLLFQLLY